MATRLPAKRLLRVSKAKVRDLEAWREGASLVATSGEPIAQLCRKVAVHRFKLAQEHRKHANAALRSNPKRNRSAVSRYYYAMYHALRSVAFLGHGGDDHEAHKTLHQKIPDDFPSHLSWSNKLKDARAYRNQADYDPYPLRDEALAQTALDLKSEVDLLFPQIKTYLQTKGCIL